MCVYVVLSADRIKNKLAACPEYQGAWFQSLKNKVK